MDDSNGRDMRYETDRGDIMADRAVCRAENIMQGERWRISVLTSRLLRFEYQQDGSFEDHATLMAQHRDFPAVDYTAERIGEGVRVETADLIVTYDGAPFSSLGLSAHLKAEGTDWYYGKEIISYGGTVRTLDQVDGAIHLEDGLFAPDGFSAIDDSGTALLDAEGTLLEERTPETDVYLFAYGRHFHEALRDYYTLTGETPMIPRYALGNWWSRFYRYTEESYKALMQRFEAEQIPLSVAVIDMDWHRVDDVPPEYGTGWTGYSWNKEFFPDPARFLGWLKEHGLAVTLNLHPRDGIRGFEDMYPAVAERVGIDPASHRQVEFCLQDPTFREAYFQEVLHPYEEMGVDFWWIDWQQGLLMPGSRIDPLWLLNHYQFQDQEESGRRPMIFSRYAGPGSHRYPVGFSGDTITTWRSLDFQPYFTSTASNIGYGWWSHDIGGHMLGSMDTERLVRWIQYGVFSPIMRLHSSDNAFFVKEPWNLQEPYRQIVTEHLRLRHRMIPYLYTMNYLQYRDGRPLVCPLYYDNPEDGRAYQVRNGYAFGTELLVFPVTQPEDDSLRMAATDAFLPEGRWIDLFTGKLYEGAQRRRLYRSLDTIPVLLKVGGIVPMADLADGNGLANPGVIDLYLGSGADGTFTMYEDDGNSQAYREGHAVMTRYEMTTSAQNGAQSIHLHIAPAEGDLALVPETRQYRIHLMGVQSAAGAVPGKVTGEQVLDVITVATAQGADVDVRDVVYAENDWRAEAFHILEQAWIRYQPKLDTWRMCQAAPDKETFLAMVQEIDLPLAVKDALAE